MDRRLAILDQQIETANAAWCHEVASRVTFPGPETKKINGKYVDDALAIYEKYLFGTEARQVARTIFLLKAAPVDSKDKMTALVERHNASVEQDLADLDYPKRTGITKGRLKEALFDTRGKKSMMITAVMVGGPGALHRSAFRSLLVRTVGKGALDDTLDVLLDAGLMVAEAGPNNSEFLISNGGLEAAHETYLKTIYQTVESLQNEPA